MGKVAVIGGGLAGVTTARELGRRGHQVTLYEAQSGPALATSFANGGLLTPSMADPWNGPGVHRHLAASLFRSDSAMKLRLRAVPSLLGWGWRFLRHSTTAQHRAATRASFSLGRYSVEETQHLREELSLDYSAARCGSIKVFSSRSALEQSLAVAQGLASLGLKFEVLSGADAVGLEPALADVRDRILGALLFPDDECGDARQFCDALLQVFRREGGLVRASTQVDGIQVKTGRVCGIQVGAHPEPADTVVVAAGNAAAPLVRPLGLSLPIRPAKGYTVTYDASHIRESAPHYALIEDALHAAIVPIGHSLRLAGTAEFAGNDLRIDPARVENLIRMLEALLPRLAAQLPRASARPWTGLRPMSADGLPFVGPAKVPGLFVNAGHGHLGWTLAAGSARLLADLIEGKTPAIDPSPYRVHRPA